MISLVALTCGAALGGRVGCWGGSSGKGGMQKLWVGREAGFLVYLHSKHSPRPDALTPPEVADVGCVDQGGIALLLGKLRFPLGGFNFTNKVIFK